MHCPRCGADVRTDATACPACGADLRGANNSAFSVYQPGQGYVPGGGAARMSMPPAPRPAQGPLSARMQRSQASMPEADGFDDSEPDSNPPYRGGSSRSGSGSPRRQSSPAYDSRTARDGAGRPPGDEPMSEDSYRANARGRGGDPYVDGRGAGARRQSSRTPYPESRRDTPPADDMDPRTPRQDSYRSRSGAGRRSARSIDEPSDPRRDDLASPLDDPRAPSELRRPTSGRPRGGTGDSYGASTRRGGYAPEPGYGPRAGFDADDQYGQSDQYDGYGEPSAQYPAYTDTAASAVYPTYDEYGRLRRDDHRGPGYQREYAEPPESSRSRPRRSTPRGDASGRSYDDYARDDGYPGPADDYANGWDDRSQYSQYGERPERRGAGLPAYEEEDAWRPGAPASSNARGASSARGRAKRKGGAGVRVAMFLLALLVATAAVGVKFGPGLYQKYTNKGAGATSQTTANGTCARQTTPAASAKPPAGSSAFATTSYMLYYPTPWQESEQVGTMSSQCDVVYAFAQPTGPARFTVEQSATFAQQTTQQVLVSEAQAAQAQGYKLTEITSAATTQGIGGEVWDRREYGVTASDGSKLHLAILVGRHAGSAYAILLLDGDTAFASDDTTVFEPVLHSLTFTS